MTVNWKPGDVALWDIDGQVEVIYRCNAGPDYDEQRWQTADSGEGYPSPNQLRRAVVIDPEDREQVERLTGALAINGANPNDRNYWRETQAATCRSTGKSRTGSCASSQSGSG